jgi:hypothetical protein
VEIGKSNSNEIVVYRGVDEGDKLYLSVPKNADKSKLNLLEKVTATASSE